LQGLKVNPEFISYKKPSKLYKAWLTLYNLRLDIN
jgi:hypothetical protein